MKRILLNFYLFFSVLLIIPKLSCQEVPDIETRFERGPQTISEVGVLQIEEVLDLLQGKKITFLESRTTISYGLLHQLGIRAIIPAVLDLREEETKLRAFGDIFLILDWHFFRRKNILMTFSAGLKLPTASNPIAFLTATQSLDFPFQFQFFHISDDWYAESTLFASFTGVPRKNIKFGNVYIASLAMGSRYNLSGSRSSNLLLIGRMTGDHFRKRKINGIIDENSGGTILLIGPDIVWSIPNLVLRCLFQVPIANRPFGIQNNADYRILFSLKALF